MIMTEFITRNYGNKEFEVIIKTDSEEHYKETQDFARKLIDHAKPQTNADRIRSMTDEELALWICGIYDIEEENGKFINGIIIPGYAPHDIEEWLQKPAEETER